jgi:hypothetical protein
VLQAVLPAVLQPGKARQGKARQGKATTYRIDLEMRSGTGQCRSMPINASQAILGELI